MKMKQYKRDGWVLSFTGPQQRHVNRSLDGVLVDVLPIGWQHGVKQQRRLNLYLRSRIEAASLFSVGEPFSIALAIARNREVIPHTVKDFVGVFQVEPLANEPPTFDETNGQFKLVVKVADRQYPDKQRGYRCAAARPGASGRPVRQATSWAHPRPETVLAGSILSSSPPQSAFP